jgi:hypothetical protein
MKASGGHSPRKAAQEQYLRHTCIMHHAAGLADSRPHISIYNQLLVIVWKLQSTSTLYMRSEAAARALGLEKTANWMVELGMAAVKRISGPGYDSTSLSRAVRIMQPSSLRGYLL